MTSSPQAICFCTTSTTAPRTASCNSAALAPGLFCSSKSSFTTRGGRGRLPVWVVRILFVLRCMGRSGRLRLRAREEADKDRGHLGFLGGPILGRDEIDVEVAGKEIVQLAARDHAMRGLGDRVVVGLVVAGDDAGRNLDGIHDLLARADDRQLRALGELLAPALHG